MKDKKIFTELSPEEVKELFKKVLSQFIFEPYKYLRYTLLILIFQKKDQHKIAVTPDKSKQSLIITGSTFHTVHFHHKCIGMLLDIFLEVFVIMTLSVSLVFTACAGGSLSFFIFYPPTQINVANFKNTHVNVGIEGSSGTTDFFCVCGIYMRNRLLLFL